MVYNRWTYIAGTVSAVHTELTTETMMDELPPPKCRAPARAARHQQCVHVNTVQSADRAYWCPIRCTFWISSDIAHISSKLFSWWQSSQYCVLSQSVRCHTPSNVRQITDTNCTQSTHSINMALLKFLLDQTESFHHNSNSVNSEFSSIFLQQ